MTGPGSTASGCSCADPCGAFPGSHGPSAGCHGSSRLRRTDFTRAGSSARPSDSWPCRTGHTSRRSTAHVECSNSCGASREKRRPFTKGSWGPQRSSPSILTTGQLAPSVLLGLIVTRRGRSPGRSTSSSIAPSSRGAAPHRRAGVRVSSESSFHSAPSGLSCGLRAIQPWPWRPELSPTHDVRRSSGRPRTLASPISPKIGRPKIGRPEGFSSRDGKDLRPRSRRESSQRAFPTHKTHDPQRRGTNSPGYELSENF